MSDFTVRKKEGGKTGVIEVPPTGQFVCLVYLPLDHIIVARHGAISIREHQADSSV